MKRILICLTLGLSLGAATASAQLIDGNRGRIGGQDRGGDHGRGDGRADHRDDQNEIPQAAEQLAQTLDGLSSVLAQRFRGLSVVHQARMLANYAHSFAQRARFEDPRSLDQSFDWLKQQFDGLDYQLQNFGCNSDFQVASYLDQARDLMRTLEECIEEGGGHDPGPGPGPWGQDWQCFAVDNGWEEHGGRSHAGFGRDQWEAQQSAISSCERTHGSCRVTNCSIVR